MNKPMKVMVAYDGSKYTDDAITDLLRARLPPAGAALIVSVADVSETTIADSYELGVSGEFMSARLLRAPLALTERETVRILEESKKKATRGDKRFLSYFSEWKTTGRTIAGNPAEELLRAADEWKPDLIVAGSHGRSGIGKFFYRQRLAKSPPKTLIVQFASCIRASRKRLPRRLKYSSSLTLCLMPSV